MPRLHVWITNGVVAVMLAFGFAAGQETEPQRDYLDLASGAIVRSYSSQARTETYSAMTVIDGTPVTGWSTEEGAPFPHSLVIELAQPVRLSMVAIDNSAAEEGGYPGISARAFSLAVSTAGPGGPFERVLEAEADQGSRSEHPLASPAQAQWLRVSITTNWGHPRYTELMELEAFGEATRAVTATDLDGVFDTNYGLLRFQTIGSSVAGCYDWDQGTLLGSRTDRVTRFEWREDGGGQVGTAILALSEAGDFINGLWYEEGRLRGFWIGERVTDGREPVCEVRTDDSIGLALEESGRAVVYGIYFDFGSDALRPESEEPLQALLQALEGRPDLHVQIEGHTDSVDTEDYNLELSRRRAEAVVNWLTEAGIDPARLSATGYGESRPVADNGTPQGRALNRRVEVVVR
jgi:flagellar motor protein MotB